MGTQRRESIQERWMHYSAAYRDWGGWWNVGDAEGDLAPRDAATLWGKVRRGFAGVGPRGYGRSDARIHEDICERLSETHGLDASDIDVAVEGGAVTLRGTVPDRASKRLAEDAAEHTRGVQSVTVELRVATGASAVDGLNALLRGELAAETTYGMALHHVHHPALRSGLAVSRASHALRAGALHHRVALLGGTPTDRAGVRGAVVRAVQAAADLFGARAAVEALEEEEDHLLRDIELELRRLDPESRRFVQATILPEQRRTHALAEQMQRMLR